ncbi:hypothetical protein OIU78_016683 [Salix suchowensis]|nr:hypothetical protein OIU78_016683 [Salix suchowensis]
MQNWNMDTIVKARYCFPVMLAFFYKVLAEMESDEVDDILINPPSCSSLALCSPARRFNSKKDGYSAYTILTPSRTLELS